MPQGEESRGYKELVAAAGRVDSVPTAICTVKEVQADYGLSSDTISVFRKVFYTTFFSSLSNLTGIYVLTSVVMWMCFI